MMNKHALVVGYREANGTPCAYCERTMDARSARLMPTKDHITPKCSGGRETVWACYDCNRIKADMTIKAWRAFMRNHPKWWFGVPARIRNSYRPGFTPYVDGNNSVNNNR